jgi:hypothetical protein
VVFAGQPLKRKTLIHGLAILLLPSFPAIFGRICISGLLKIVLHALFRAHEEKNRLNVVFLSGFPHHEDI